jgi:ElaB/YqjD/DUF883 family membrane-anchored ribosome-binding protein
MDAHEITGTAEELKGKAEQTYGKMRDRMSPATEQEFETFSDTALRGVEETWEKTVDLIRENPASSVGIALLVGAGIGALLTAWASD